MNVNAATNLKAKFIKDFDKLRQSLYKGVKPNINVLKYMTCVIHDYEHFNSNVYEYLMTYE
jgi:phage regulator Rha-like protein